MSCLLSIVPGAAIFALLRHKDSWKLLLRQARNGGGLPCGAATASLTWALILLGNRAAKVYTLVDELKT